MIKFILASLLIVGSCLSVEARFHKGGVANPAVNLPCPQATDNGCAASPGGNVLISNLFSGYTGTIYPGRPAFNVPCVDYKCGMPENSNPSYSFTLGGITVVGSCGMNSMVDPASVSPDPSSDDPGCGKMPKHCIYSTAIVSDQLSLPTVTCSATSNDIVFRGFNMAAVGGHLSTYLTFSANQTGRKVMVYNNFGADQAVYYRNSMAVVTSPSQGNIVFLANNVNGHWVDNFSTIGTGSCSFLATTMTCTGDTGFGLGQAVDATGVIGQAVIQRINGGGSYTLNASQNTLTARSTRGVYIMGSGLNFNSSGSIIVEYNAFMQNNGRDITTQSNPTFVGTGFTITDSLNKYNYYEGAIYADIPAVGTVHFEAIEYTIANSTHPVTFTNLDQSGNVCYIPSIAGNITACFWNHSGAISTTGGTGSDFIVNYTNVTVDKNVAICLPATQCLTAIGADNRPGGGPVTNYTLTNNWISKNGAGTYTGCSGNPYLVGNTGQPESFVTASSNASTNKLVVTVFAGGTPIIADGSNFVAESHQQILSQDSGTPGGAGTYSTSGGITLTSRAMRSAYPEVINAPTINTNIDLLTNTPILGSNIVTRADNTHTCVYSGMQ